MVVVVDQSDGRELALVLRKNSKHLDSDPQSESNWRDLNMWNQVLRDILTHAGWRWQDVFTHVLLEEDQEVSVRNLVRYDHCVGSLLFSLLSILEVHLSGFKSEVWIQSLV